MTVNFPNQNVPPICMPTETPAAELIEANTASVDDIGGMMAPIVEPTECPTLEQFAGDLIDFADLMADTIQNVIGAPTETPMATEPPMASEPSMATEPPVASEPPQAPKSIIDTLKNFFFG